MKKKKEIEEELVNLKHIHRTLDNFICKLGADISAILTAAKFKLDVDKLPRLAMEFEKKYKVLIDITMESKIETLEWVLESKKEKEND